MGNFYVYFGNGWGGWLWLVVIGCGWLVLFEVVFVGDWDGDGYFDVLVCNDLMVWLYLFCGNGCGGWFGVKIIGYGWSGYLCLVGLGDWIGDGYFDLFIVNIVMGVFYVYCGNGCGGWLLCVVVGLGWGGIE